LYGCETWSLTLREAEGVREWGAEEELVRGRYKCWLWELDEANQHVVKKADVLTLEQAVRTAAAELRTANL
jgi:hypothetical protein